MNVTQALLEVPKGIAFPELHWSELEIGTHMMHPAWLAAFSILQDPDRWFERRQGLLSGYRDWQIYMAMAVEGYADDVIVYNDEDDVQRFVFPPVVIPVDEDDGEGIPGL